MTDTKNDVYKAELDGIRAPLGVLLYLIRRDSLDIYDIPIAKVTRDYLAYLDLLEEAQIELAGEFFVLAATLMRIKAQMLLRRDEDEEDPREELVRNLVEYKKMVEAAQSLKRMEEDRAKVFNRPIPQHEKEYKSEPVFDLNLYQIMKAFREVVAGFEAADTREIELEVFTIEEKIEVILSKVERGQTRFQDLFADSASRLELIVTFMAMLELLKRLAIKVRQESQFGDIWVYPGEGLQERESETVHE